jgi:hypothetical protein
VKIGLPQNATRRCSAATPTGIAQIIDIGFAKKSMTLCNIVHMPFRKQKIAWQRA